MEEVECADEDGGGVALRVMKDSHGGEDVGLFAAEDFDGGLERLAALELLDDERVAGGGHGAWAPVACDEEGVFVEPGDVLLGMREVEAVGDEVGGSEVELAEGCCIFATGGEAGEAEGVTG